jgi:glycosyltransferase involved in cell wall biosynthesis
MKIYVNARFLTQPVSGVQRYGIESSLQIKMLYPNTTFVSPGNILYKDIADALGVEVIGRNTGHLWEQIDLPLYLAKKGAPPLLNLANTAPLLYSNNYYTLHDLAFSHNPEWNSALFSAWYNFFVPRVARKARHIFTVSQTMRDEISRHYQIPPKKISVTYNGIAAHMLNNAGAPPPKENIILSVGTFNMRKNHHNLIKAFLQSSIKNRYRLVIVGDKNKVFKEVNIDDSVLAGNNITILERLPEDALRDMYQKAEVVASLSMYEGFGIPLLEGLFYGCKIICSDIPVYHELYNEHGQFCDPLDVAAITEALNKVPTTEFNSSGLSGLFEKYNYKRTAEEILKVIVPTTG